MSNHQDQSSPPKSQLILHRIYVKNSLFESSAVTLDSFQNPIHPFVEMQVFVNTYAKGDDTHEAVLSLKITAKHDGNQIWRLQLEEAGLYKLESFAEEQKNDILNGFCMGQLYSYANTIVTQMVTQAGFLPLYLQPMDFNRLYQKRKKEDQNKQGIFFKKEALSTFEHAGGFSEQVIN